MTCLSCGVAGEFCLYESAVVNRGLLEHGEYDVCRHSFDLLRQCCSVWFLLWLVKQLLIEPTAGLQRSAAITNDTHFKVLCIGFVKGIDDVGVSEQRVKRAGGEMEGKSGRKRETPSALSRFSSLGSASHLLRIGINRICIRWSTMQCESRRTWGIPVYWFNTVVSVMW